jgi:anaerobic ribonucleoside-triphosphate reductase activating protein
MTVKKTQTLGPYTRYAIWTQGCHRCCPGCISPASRDPGGGYEEDVAALAADILQTAGIEGITISGGEPFLQAEALAALIKSVKAARDLGVVLYTGYTLDEVAGNELAQLCDIIIDGVYMEELNDGLSLRGSANQKVCLMTDRYKEEAGQLYGVAGRKIEIHIKEGKATMVGIPDQKSLAYLQGADTQNHYTEQGGNQ